jgi:FkbM family methyltransferase
MTSLKTLIKRALRSRGYKLVRVGDSNAVEFLLHRLIARKRITFVQVGANDGRTADPLFEFVTFNHRRVRGLVVEPVKDYFEELARNYRTYPTVTPVRVAIHRTEKEMTIWRVDPARQRAEGLRKGIASFNPDHYKRYDTPDDAMVPEKVPCMSLEELLREYRIADLDLLMIDTEGYDAEILRGIDFDTLKPGIIRFEHGRLKTMPRDTFIEVSELLRGQGYEIIIEPHDAIAYRPQVMLDL